MATRPPYQPQYYLKVYYKINKSRLPGVHAGLLPGKLEVIFYHIEVQGAGRGFQKEDYKRFTNIKGQRGIQYSNERKVELVELKQT